MRRRFHLAGLLLVLAACNGGDPGEAESTEGPPPVRVEAVVLETTPFAERTWLPADVRAWENARISAETLGRITWVCCEEGESVRRGQHLARIDTDMARAELARVAADLAHAEREVERLVALVAREAATRRELDGATARRDALAAGLEQARTTVDRAVLQSPFDGRVVRRHARPGELARPGEPLFDLADIANVKVVAGLPERDFAYLKEGERTQVRIDAYPETSFEGVVERIGLVAGQARTFPVEVRVANADGRLRPGMVAQVRLTKRTFEAAVVVPQDAVIDEYDGQRVYVVGADGAAVEREVVLGPAGGRQVVVTSGLSAGDRLVVTGHRFLTDGRPVTVVREGRLDDDGRPRFEATEDDDGLREGDDATGEDGGLREGDDATGEDGGLREDDDATGEDGVREDDGATGEDGVREDDGATGEDGPEEAAP
jgi:membrane fusion protein, multidrug efflux system